MGDAGAAHQTEWVSWGRAEELGRREAEAEQAQLPRHFLTLRGQGDPHERAQL